MPASLKIAVLEDHDALRDLFVAALQRDGHEAFGVADAEALDEALMRWRIDVLLLDLNLPGEDGLSVAQRLRKAMPGLFIIMSTAKGSVSDRVAGYASGADIYLPKPVSQDELLGAVAGVARRIEQSRPAQGVSALQLDCAALALTGRHSVSLSPAEATLLRALAQAPDQMVPTYRLLEATQRPVDPRAKATLEVQMVSLRKKIAAAGFEGPALRAVRKQGYQLLCQVQVV